MRTAPVYLVILTHNINDDLNVLRKTDNQFVIPLETYDTCFDAKALGRAGNSFTIRPGENAAAH
jgi:hypothetical protein